VETDFRALSRRQGTLPAPYPAHDRYSDTGRLLITCPDRPGIVAAVSCFLFDHGANITESQQYSTDPFGGTFFLRVGFHLDTLAGRFDDLAEGFGQLADRFSMRWKMTRAADTKRVVIMVSKADHALHQNKTVVFT
jgi:formyltetrahydrofolate deformylase